MRLVRQDLHRYLTGAISLEDAKLTADGVADLSRLANFKHTVCLLLFIVYFNFAFRLPKVKFQGHLVKRLGRIPFKH